MAKKEPKNIKFGVKGSKLVLTIDLGAIERGDMELSESGKSYVIATTHGNQKLTVQGYEDVRVSLNVFIPKAVVDAKKVDQQQKEQAKEAAKELIASQLEMLAKQMAELQKQLAELK